MVKAEEIPRCKECNAVSRPNILMFRDSMCVKLRFNEQRDRFDEWIEKVKSKKLKAVVLEIGAGTSVGTVRANSEKFAKETNSSIIRVNPEYPQVPQQEGVQHVSLKMDCLDGLDKIWCYMEKPPSI